MNRKLTSAVDENGKAYHIDSFSNKDKKQKLFCPYCKLEVVARMGKEKVWHFAHIHGECQDIKVVQKNQNDHPLTEFFTRTISSKDYKPHINPDFFTCIICNNSMRIESGIKINDGRYICKDCYKTADIDTINKLPEFF